MKRLNIYLLVLAGIMLAGFVTMFIANRNDKIRYKGNMDSLMFQMQGLKSNLTQLEFNNREMKDFITTMDTAKNSLLYGIKDKLEANRVEMKRLNRLVVTSINTVDTTYNRIVLDSINKIIAALGKQTDSTGSKVVLPFEDKSTCFEFKAQVVFESGEVSVEVLERKYNDTLYNASSWERRQWKLLGFIKTRFLGRKIAKVTIWNDCGFQKTIIIDNRKQRVKR